MKIAIAQINPKVGDIKGNALKIASFATRAQSMGAELAVFPELAITGYPPLDLLERSDFVDANLKALRGLAALRLDIALAVGYVDRNGGRGKKLQNSIALIADGRVKARQAKSLLPTYDIFDEARYFEPAASNRPADLGGTPLGLTICEDIWADTGLLPERLLYKVNPVRALLARKARLIINVSASPYYKGKGAKRLKILSALAKRMGACIVYANQAGANDELIFDGNSFAVGPDGRLLGKARAFEEDLLLIDTEAPPRKAAAERADDYREIFSALTLGIRDYFFKLGFKKAVLGLSGGIDSAVVAALAAKALGPENVTAFLMPSEFTAARSLRDAARLAGNLGVRTETLPVKSVYSAFLKTLGPKHSGPGAGVNLTMQNLQARVRGSLLMAAANTNNWLVLTTGNKSEIAMGYCTLYGDTAGALAPIADLLKTEVYKLAALINRDREVIPRSIIERPPTAELKPGQKDQDDLPPYAVLDAIIRLYLEENLGAAGIISRGFAAELVKKTLARIEAAEYKRRQLPIGLKVTERSFCCGRKMPIVKDLEYLDGGAD